MLNICVFSFVYSKARTLFEKNAAPILHLSGMDVTVVKVRTAPERCLIQAAAPCNIATSLDLFVEISSHLRAEKPTLYTCSDN